MTKVLYVMGFGRSGSTILDNLLNEVEGFVSTGELHNLFRRGLLRGQACGCSKPVPTCEFWRSVLAREVDGVSLDADDPSEILSWQEQMLRPRHTRRLLRFSRHSERPPALERYSEVLRRLYLAVAEAAEARVVVDSSKWPSPAALLPALDGIDAHLIHLVRDPRAVAFSRRRVKAGLDHEMRRRSAPYISLRWVQRDAQARRVLDRYPPERRMTLLYEDFAASPRSTVERVVAFVGENGNTSFLDERRAHLAGNHT
ncbi:MAG: sulfotransferase, partial [Actinomycetota bacterium]